MKVIEATFPTIPLPPMKFVSYWHELKVWEGKNGVYHELLPKGKKFKEEPATGESLKEITLKIKLHNLKKILEARSLYRAHMGEDIPPTFNKLYPPQNCLLTLKYLEKCD